MVILYLKPQAWKIKAFEWKFIEISENEKKNSQKYERRFYNDFFTHYRIYDFVD